LADVGVSCNNVAARVPRVAAVLDNDATPLGAGGAARRMWEIISVDFFGEHWPNDELNGTSIG
jgi:hypothetical protein